MSFVDLCANCPHPAVSWILALTHFSQRWITSLSDTSLFFFTAFNFLRLHLCSKQTHMPESSAVCARVCVCNGRIDKQRSTADVSPWSHLASTVMFLSLTSTGTNTNWHYLSVTLSLSHWHDIFLSRTHNVLHTHTHIHGRDWSGMFCCFSVCAANELCSCSRPSKLLVSPLLEQSQEGWKCRSFKFWVTGFRQMGKMDVLGPFSIVAVKKKWCLKEIWVCKMWYFSAKENHTPSCFLSSCEACTKSKSV